MQLEKAAEEEDERLVQDGVPDDEIADGIGDARDESGKCRPPLAGGPSEVPEPGRMGVMEERQHRLDAERSEALEAPAQVRERRPVDLAPARLDPRDHSTGER